MVECFEVLCDLARDKVNSTVRASEERPRRTQSVVKRARSRSLKTKNGDHSD